MGKIPTIITIASRGAAQWLRVCLVAGLAAYLFSNSSGALADAEHLTIQAMPIELGTSGASVEDLYVNACCTAGTLGALVVDELGGLHILSNNHVLARINEGEFGAERIIHTGVLDQECTQEAYNDPTFYDGDVVAHLSDFVPLKFDGTDNYVDAAIARIVNGAVDPFGTILDIGVPDFDTQTAAVDMKVTKSGRTTGQTFAKVAAVDVTVNVRYSTACSSDEKVAKFVNQIRIRGKRIRGIFYEQFSGPGDSGSLIVTDDGEYRPVGLLFAGSSVDTFANSIDTVLAEIGGVSIVGQDNTPNAGGGGDDGGDGGGGKKGKPPGKGKDKDVGVGLEIASEVKSRHAPDLFALPGVVGTGVSVDENGEAVIEIYVEGAARDVRRPIPPDLEGIPVRVVVTGKVRAF